MLLGIYSIRLILSISIIGFTIKIMDDYIDDDKSLTSNLFNEENKAILPYSLMFFSLSCLLDKNIAISYISSAYIIGMFHDFFSPLSFKIKGYQESIIIILINILFLSFMEFVTSIFIIFIIQIWDDIIDISKDKYYGNKSLALKFGVVEVLIFSMILFSISLKVKLIKTLISVTVFLSFEIIEILYIRKEEL